GSWDRTICDEIITPSAGAERVRPAPRIRVSGQCARPPGLPPSSLTATAAPATSVPFRVVGKGSYRSRAGKGEEPDDIDMAGGELHRRKRFGRGPDRAGRGGGARRRGIRVSAAQGAIAPSQGRTSPVRPVGLEDVSAPVRARGPGRRGAARQRGEQPSRLAVRLSARVRAVPAVRSGPVTVDGQGPGGQRPAVLSRSQGSGARSGGRPPSQARPGLPKVFVSGRRVLRQRWVVLAADTGGATRC